MTKVSNLDFSILDRDFSVACPDSERQNLLAAAQYLDTKMREIQQGGKVSGQDRIAIMAGLNFAYELLTTQSGGVNLGSLKQKVHDLETKLDQALSEQKQLSSTD
jgi:cell division protein ZapA